MDPLYFYHSFPQGGDPQRGLAILDSILKWGFLLTAEARQLPATLNQPPATHVQCRVCFTAIPACELKRHSEVFGRFSLEFECQSLRDFGVMPVVYFSGKRAAGTLLHGAGSIVARQLLAAHEVMLHLIDKAKNGDASEKAVAAKIFADAKHNLKTPEEMHYALATLLNLSYSTDTRDGDEMEYFREREWRIVPNLAFAGGSWLYPSPTKEQAAALRNFDATWCDKTVGDRTQLEQCRFLQQIEKQDILARIRRIIVPADQLDAARGIVAKYSFDEGRLVRMEDKEFAISAMDRTGGRA